jgi:hypothetical protein
LVKRSLGRSVRFEASVELGGCVCPEPFRHLRVALRLGNFDDLKHRAELLIDEGREEFF